MQRIWGSIKTKRFNPKGTVPLYIQKTNTTGSLFVTRSYISNQNYITPFLVKNEEIISGKKFGVYNPCDSELLWNTSAASLSDDQKVRKAAAPEFPSWSTTKLAKRTIFVDEICQYPHKTGRIFEGMYVH